MTFQSQIKRPHLQKVFILGGLLFRKRWCLIGYINEELDEGSLKEKFSTLQKLFLDLQTRVVSGQIDERLGKNVSDFLNTLGKISKEAREISETNTRAIRHYVDLTTPSKKDLDRLAMLQRNGANLNSFTFRLVDLKIKANILASRFH